ncbi:MAG: FAD-binding protein [Microthrixaceae bacterium]|nr:FAD-binding protein [Microthrixaceae bacterium]
MTTERLSFDVVVVGAGTAGANAAVKLAVGGRRVLLLERRGADAAGAQWHNGVLDWQFDAAGVARPAPPERAPTAPRTHIVGPDGHYGVCVQDNPVTRADMALLGRRLRRAAQDAGVEIVDHVEGIDVRTGGDRLVAVEVAVAAPQKPPRSLSVEAALFVDASGRAGVLRRHSRPLAPWCPEIGGDELCTAADHHLRIDDVDGARRFLDRFGAAPGEAVTMVGLAGGFSTRAITVSADLSEASVLVGCLANGRYSTGSRMLSQTRADEPWLGASISGGAGLIPLRRPYARLSAPGIALVGDAACQVFPAHGSGIGMGLLAGSMLAEAVAGASDPGDENVLWAYQADFQRTHGGMLAAFDTFRRMSTALGGRGVGRMMRAGLLNENLVRAGLDQRWQVPDRAAMPAMAYRMARVPSVAARMLPLLARGQLLYPMGGRYPIEADVVALGRWNSRVERLLGPLPS